MTQKQAAELLMLQELTKQQSDLTKSQADSSEKISNASNPRNLSETVWPLLQAHSTPTMPQNGSLLAPHRGNVHVDPKVTQQVTLASKQLLIDYGPLKKGKSSSPKPLRSKGISNNFLMIGSMPLPQSHQKSMKGSPLPPLMSCLQRLHFRLSGTTSRV